MELSIEKKREIESKLKVGGIKIRVNPEQSKTVQEYLISLGYRWLFHGRDVMDIDAPFLYAEDRWLYGGRKALCNGYREEAFVCSKDQEIIL